VTSTEVPRPPGRPRSAEADEAILEAAVELFAEVGLEGLTVEGVAARAGVGKATVYRRYPCKVDLVMAATVCFNEQQAPSVDTGSVRADIRAAVDGLIAVLTSTPAGRALPTMVADRVRTPELGEAFHQFVTCRRARSTAIVERAIERGEIRADAHPDEVVDFYVGPIFYRYLISDAPLDPAFAEAVVDATLRAFGT
jgi:AcrR family transcriptional regulator